MELFPPQYLRDIAANIRKSPVTLAYLCLRDVLDEGPDLIALMATHGAMGYREALASVRALLSGKLDTESAVDLFDVAALAALARLMAGRPGPGLDYSDSADIAQAVRRMRRGAPLPRDTDRIEVQVSLAAGRFDHVESHMGDYELDDVAAWMVRTELMHPHTGRPGSLPGPWLQEFNGIFRAHGMLPVSLASRHLDQDEAQRRHLQDPQSRDRCGHGRIRHVQGLRRLGSPRTHRTPDGPAPRIR